MPKSRKKSSSPRRRAAAPRHRSITQRLQLTGENASAPLDLLRPGMPALDSIRDDKTTFTPTKGGPTYRILKTTETDGYENSATAVALRQAVQGVLRPDPAALEAADKLSVVRAQPGQTEGAAALSDDFVGTDRKAAKLSIAAAKTQTYKNVSLLIDTVPHVADMVKLNISQEPTSNRVPQENRNVHVSGYLYACSREADNDFHLVVGLPPTPGQETYMTMEVSGLPPSTDAAYPELNAARTAFKAFFKNKSENLPGAGYHFYDPPIPVTAEGSLFFDVKHATGIAPGPKSLKSRMITIWEVHPVTKIVLGP